MEDQRFEVPRHPIGVAAERTGLSTDLIRAWERRYGAVEPARDDAGQRLYSDADVERLRLLAEATAGGRSIGRVAGLARERLAELVRGDEEARSARRPAEAAVVPADDLDALEAMAVRLAGEQLETSLRQRLLEVGFVPFVETVAAPLLRRLGEGWHEGRVTTAQEHLASSAVRRVLESMRQAARPGGEERPVVVVGTLSGERHEAGILAAAAAAGLAGWRVAYLGADLPVPDLAEAVRTTGARAVCVSGTFPDPDRDGEDPLVEALRALKASVPASVEVYAGGPAVAVRHEALKHLGIRVPDGLAALRDALQRQDPARQP